ncbi:carboxypeptidase B-like [Agrilus planipennis]|uniref:Carboxypeptidase B-like n=1 Tax=Agrilus planipennis TaxID=224129 RepID=A0A7F5RMR9_AGRPL|nr:carboxypeptidase B-like [Agrilus planipennis]
MQQEPLFYTKFPTYKEIVCYVKLIKLLYPKNVAVFQIGKSCQGRKILMVRLSENVDCLKNHAVLIDAGIHAREWLTHTTCLYILNNILEDPSVLSLMDFYFIPCLNPDGYVETHKCNRLWRKNLNRNNSKKKARMGVDLNRNFPVAFGTTGCSNDPKSLMYHGKYPLSEPESKSLAEVMRKFEKCLKLYISLHAYGNVILYPWGFKKAAIKHSRELQCCAAAACEAVLRKCGECRFTYGSIARKMYVSSGNTADFSYGMHNITFSYIIELQKGSRHQGFGIRKQMIKRVGEEVLAAVIGMVEYVFNFYNEKRQKRIKCARKCTSRKSGKLKRRSKRTKCSSSEEDCEDCKDEHLNRKRKIRFSESDESIIPPKMAKKDCDNKDNFMHCC